MLKMLAHCWRDNMPRELVALFDTMPKKVQTGPDVLTLVAKALHRLGDTTRLRKIHELELRSSRYYQVEYWLLLSMLETNPVRHLLPFI
jgi:hypothetical protein